MKISTTQYQWEVATAFLIVTFVLQVIAAIVVFARVYTRAFPWRFTVDDYLVTVAFAILTVMFAFATMPNMWAWGGRHPKYRTFDDIHANSKWGALTMPLWAWSTGLVKISIACMLLRFQQDKGWRIFMFTMIGFNILLIIFTGIWNLIQCIPLSKLWDVQNKITHFRCTSDSANHTAVFITSACNVSSDIVFSLMPLTFLGKIRRPLQEKVVIGGLMALGLVASSFSLAKAILAGRLAVPNYLNGKDMGAYLSLFGFLSMLEVQTSLIAACIPTLRSATRVLLHRIGLLHTGGNDSACMQYGPGSSMSGRPKGRRPSLGRPLELPRIETGSENSGVGEDSIQTADDRESRYDVDPETGRVVRTPPKARVR
ncbi:hypothetical protein EJ04DRAFT_440360 [Polyplosphaeria fusca]|uniref:Rhodopsin domain-containing protein n=1 Tax=Polyplosphaeria fusca TaxID=682080 RepID=A0A9P4QS45_9PLEO|nr:hypothetical protein EJ04DRAFT_440360 [Polyplosphaeria fusca]